MWGRKKIKDDSVKTTLDRWEAEQGIDDSPKHKYRLRAFPKHYVNHIDHDILVMTLTELQAKALMDVTMDRLERWWYREGLDTYALFNGDAYRTIIVERITKDGTSRVQLRNAADSDEVPDQSSDSGDRQGDAPQESGAGPNQGDYFESE
jgi:hypothetical protein